MDRPELDWNKVWSVYSDGGVIGPNPSAIGGTWAFAYTNSIDARIAAFSGRVTPADVQLPKVTNNLTELLALLLAVEHLPAGWRGSLFTDSLITLRRFERPRRAKFEGIPDSLQNRVADAVERLGAHEIHLLSGHPTREELAIGRGRKSRLVSIHNVHCDKLCNEEAAKYRRVYA